MDYREVVPIDRFDAELALASGDPPTIGDALVRLAYHDPDWRWVEHQCIRFLSNDDASVRGVAATCLGHLARIHRTLDTQLVVPLLEKLRADKEIGGRAEDALEDIRQYVANPN